MASIMCMPFTLVFPSVHFLLLPRTVYIFEFVHGFVCALSLRRMLISRALRAGVKTLYTINQFSE